ncbi:hypothetical protein BGW36DRAFT_431954 [Talaromyces proteolyticus]|uniref:Response regulatory domain-containing protein n=1 Tax=Talaromyces proteolyticus TaxID=1131652 RepID=A0AAD4KGP4_9EURO|nr:uncharacterized protein BGW36DRAFT_431954 [Talaromyces proteolyticus]KAH8691406.1 hypothetical protein BGW36DRAFT_431954 [Talaromyces proteolyticus]
MEEEAGSMVDSSNSKGRPAQSPVDIPVNSRIDPTVPPIYQLNPVAPVEARVLIPVFTALTTSSRPTALLIDNNVINLRIMQRYCNKRGLPYSYITNGIQAVDICTQHQLLAAAGEGAAIQLILVDLQMPVCGGIESIRQIRWLKKQNKWKKSILFIMIDQDSLTDRMAVDGAGADENFVKPCWHQTSRSWCEMASSSL